MKKSFYLATLLFLLSSCGQDLTNGALKMGTTTSAATTSNCGCPATVDPVCVSMNQTSLTFKNGCLAQCAGYQYTSGGCTTDTCNSNSGPVCGTLNTDLSPKVYTDECSLLRAGANQVANSDCGL